MSVPYFAIGEEVIHAPTGTVHTILRYKLVTPEDEKNLLGGKTLGPYYGYWYELSELDKIQPGIYEEIKRTLFLLELFGKRTGRGSIESAYPLVPQPVLRKKPPAADMKFKELIKHLNNPKKFVRSN